MWVQPFYLLQPSSTNYKTSCLFDQGGHALLFSARTLAGRSQTGRSPLLVHLQQAGWGAHPDLSGGQAARLRLGGWQSSRADVRCGGDDWHPGADWTGRVEWQRCHGPVRVRGLEHRMFTKNSCTSFLILHSRQTSSSTRVYLPVNFTISFFFFGFPFLMPLFVFTIFSVTTAVHMCEFDLFCYLRNKPFCLYYI